MLAEMKYARVKGNKLNFFDVKLQRLLYHQMNSCLDSAFLFLNEIGNMSVIDRKNDFFYLQRIYVLCLA